MNFIKLNNEDFSKQVVEFGYFSEQLPACFSSKMMVEHLDEIMKNISTNWKKMSNKKVTSPLNISIYKNDVSRRILSLPNPEMFLKIVKFYSENWDTIKELSYSPNSLSPITYLRSYLEDSRIEEINSENLRENVKAKSDFIEGVKECISISLGYQYKLKVDIANCYNSIYTHSITWAICGKTLAKKYLRTKEPESLKEKYELGDALDKLIRFQKNNETNGIVVGPFTSRIFSEIILAAIDSELRNYGYVFKRYVDDYKFYFRTEFEAQQSIKFIEKILNEYNLNLNL